MDEYKTYLYDRDFLRYEKVDPGDLTKQMALKKKCKPFKWFLEEVAPDVLKKYPPVVPHMAWGTIRSPHKRSHCVDDLSKKKDESAPIGIYSCGINDTYPQQNQYYSLNFNHRIETIKNDACWKAINKTRVALSSCTDDLEQKWSYDNVRASRFLAHRFTKLTFFDLAQPMDHLAAKQALCERGAGHRLAETDRVPAKRYDEVDLFETERDSLRLALAQEGGLNLAHSRECTPAIHLYVRHTLLANIISYLLVALVSFQHMRAEHHSSIDMK